MVGTKIVFTLCISSYWFVIQNNNYLLCILLYVGNDDLNMPESPPLIMDNNPDDAEATSRAVNVDVNEDINMDDDIGEIWMRVDGT